MTAVSVDGVYPRGEHGPFADLLEHETVHPHTRGDEPEPKEERGDAMCNMCAAKHELLHAN